MPKLPDVPQTLRVRFIGTDAADTDLGSHVYLRYTGAAPTSAQLATTATAWGSLWVTSMAPMIDTGYTLTLLEIIDLSSSTAATTETVMSHPGTRPGTALPLNVALTVTALTPLRRRGGHWHAQLRAGVQADTATPQTWTSAFVNAASSAWQTLLNSMNTSLWSGATGSQTVAVQYYGPPNKIITSSTGRVRTVSTLLTTPVIYPVTGWTARTRLGSQRRRLG